MMDLMIFLRLKGKAKKNLKQRKKVKKVKKVVPKPTPNT